MRTRRNGAISREKRKHGIHSFRRLCPVPGCMVSTLASNTRRHLRAHRFSEAKVEKFMEAFKKNGTGLNKKAHDCPVTTCGALPRMAFLGKHLRHTHGYSERQVFYAVREFRSTVRARQQQRVTSQADVKGYDDLRINPNETENIFETVATFCEETLKPEIFYDLVFNRLFGITEKLDKYIPREILFARSMHYVKCFFPHWTPYRLRSSVKRAKALKVKFVQKTMGQKPKLKSNDVAPQPQKKLAIAEEKPKVPTVKLETQSNEWTPTDLSAEDFCVDAFLGITDEEFLGFFNEELFEFVDGPVEQWDPSLDDYFVSCGHSQERVNFPSLNQQVDSLPGALPSFGDLIPDDFAPNAEELLNSCDVTSLDEIGGLFKDNYLDAEIIL